MKLIFCNTCQDVVKLSLKKRTCECGKSWGYYYADCTAARIGGDAIPLGFLNGSFVQALHERPEKGFGAEFTAFVIPKHVPTIKVDDEP